MNNYIFPFLWMKGESQEIIAEEISKIDECGIKAICLESRPHPDFMGEKWWDDLAFIIDECKKRDMKIWILDDAHFPTGFANGLIGEKYPDRKKKFINYNVVDIFAKTGKVSINVKRMTKPLIHFMDIGKPMDFEGRSRNKLLAVVAYPMREGKMIDETGVIDLTDKVLGDYVDYEFQSDSYRVFVVYETDTDGGRDNYINMMDKTSVSTLIEAVYEPHFEHFKEEFGQTILGFFSDEPEIGNCPGYSSDTVMGNSKMPLPWSKALKDKMIETWGDTWKERIPLLWYDSVQMSTCSDARYDFMDAVTQLYRDNFSMQLGKWCKEHGVEYIGHVVEDDNLHQKLGSGAGHYFRAMAGQHMAGIDAIGNQITPGDNGYMRSGVSERDGAFYHYTLAKLGASAAHLDPVKKGRTVCELFGASGWETGVRDMKFILDHLLVRGVNNFVPHAFSMAEYPDEDCPPHFYARGNNPQFKYFAKLMKYANRMCELLNGGQHITDVAVLYSAECEWKNGNVTLEKITKSLQQSQIDFDIVPIDYLPEKGFEINGICFKHLIIPVCDKIPDKLQQFIGNNPEIDIIYADDAFLNSPLDRLDATVKLSERYKDIVVYKYNKGHNIYVLHNESAFDTYKGKIELPIANNAIYYDTMNEKYYSLDISSIDIELAPQELMVIVDCDKECDKYIPLSEKLSSCNKQVISDGKWQYELSTEKFFPKTMGKEEMDELMPVSDIIPEFSGHIFYEKAFELSDKKEKVYLEFEEVHENIEVYVNDIRIGDAIGGPYVFDISSAVKEGENKLVAIVTTTLDRDQVNYDEPFIIMSHHVSEPAGLCKKVNIYY